jgi:hypothetical protein
MDFPISTQLNTRNERSQAASDPVFGIYITYKSIACMAYDRNYFIFKKNGKGSTGLPFWRISKYRTGAW